MFRFSSQATLAQLVEQLIRNQQVAGSTPAGGSNGINVFLVNRLTRNRLSLHIASKISRHSARPVLKGRLPTLRLSVRV
jgi:hypothetical protein